MIKGENHIHKLNLAIDETKVNEQLTNLMKNKGIIAIT